MKPNEPIDIQRHFHLGQMLGEGGMGRVLEGFAPDLGQHLAIKQLRAEWMEDADVRARFEEEATIMASIDHPGVLPVYGIGIDAGRHLFYAMKKVEGRTLGQLIADPFESFTSAPRRKRLTGFLLDACETVASAHDKGIVHRDLKPDNILVDRGQSVYVIDWGLAKHTGVPGGSSQSGRTLPGKVMGTPGYMAPEQADGRSARAGAEADVFALGAILYEILTGRRPFAAGDDRAEMLGAIHQDPTPPRHVNWLVPRDLNAVCLKALHKDPAKRYPSAGSLAADLRAHLEGRAVSAIRPNLMERIRYAARRRPMRAVIMASSLVGLTLVAAFIGNQRWIDHRLADKAVHRLETIDAEIYEIESEDRDLRRQLAARQLPDRERARILDQLEINDSRWILAQFEAYRVLNSVAELRFIRTNSNIQPMARQRLMAAIAATIDRGHTTLGAAIIATYLERADEQTLTSPLSRSDRQNLLKLAEKATNTRQAQ
jgi:serine/threonine protein kinase